VFSASAACPGAVRLAYTLAIYSPPPKSTFAKGPGAPRRDRVTPCPCLGPVDVLEVRGAYIGTAPRTGCVTMPQR